MRKDLKLKHIQDMTELYEHEIENIATGIAWAESTRKDHRDYMVWLEVHRRMFNSVWKWAGQIRSRELANPDFKMPYDIRPSLVELEKDLTYWLENKTYSHQEMSAIFHEKLLTIHPFNDGNGRWSRVLTEFVCSREGLEVPNWGKDMASDEERRNRYVAAIKKARHQGEYKDLMGFMFISLSIH